MRQAGAKRSKLPICGGIKAEFADDVIFRSLGNLVRKWPKNSRETPYSAPEVIVDLLIDLSKQPRPCIPAKLVRCATAAPKFFFQRMSLEISCSPSTGPVRHFNCAAKKLAGIPLRAYELYSTAFLL